MVKVRGAPRPVRGRFKSAPAEGVPKCPYSHNITVIVLLVILYSGSVARTAVAGTLGRVSVYMDLHDHV